MVTTARERYEAKTKVVTFRVRLDIYDDLTKIKAKAGLSFADLIKAGAGVAREELVAKIAETDGLQKKIEELRDTVQTERKRAADIAAKEKQEQLHKLKLEAKVFRLFDLGWSIQESRYKLGMSQEEISRHFKEWGDLRGEHLKVQTELLRDCLKRHILCLQEQIVWPSCQPGWKEGVAEAKRQLERCQRLLMEPSQVTKEETSFLISEYSSLVNPRSSP